MKATFFVIFALLFASLRADGEGEFGEGEFDIVGEAVECDDIDGTYSTILQVSPYTFSQYFNTVQEGTDTDFEGYPNGYANGNYQAWQSPDIVAHSSCLAF